VYQPGIKSDAATRWCQANQQGRTCPRWIIRWHRGASRRTTAAHLQADHVQPRHLRERRPTNGYEARSTYVAFGSVLLQPMSQVMPSLTARDDVRDVYLLFREETSGLTIRFDEYGLKDICTGYAGAV
jgi:hypothetical protein